MGETQLISIQNSENAKEACRRTTPQKSVTIGIFFAVITFIGDGFQSIVSNSRPVGINPLLFAWITACIELAFIFPFFLHAQIQRAKKKQLVANQQAVFTKKQMLVRLSIAGVIFSGCAYYLIVGFSMVDSVTGIIAVKTQPVSMMIIGALFLKEKLSLKEVVVGILMFILIIFLTTKGTFDIGYISLGVIYLLLVPFFWNIGHSLAKPFLKHEILSVSEFVFIRIGFTAVILGIFLAIAGNQNDLRILSEQKSLISIFTMGILFGLLHTCWYKAVKALPLSIASLIVIPSPAVTAILAYFLTKEPLHYYHFIGIFCMVILLGALIIFQKNKPVLKGIGIDRGDKLGKPAGFVAKN